MSKVIKAGTVIKLSPDLFKTGFKPDGHFGSLGYPGIMRDWFFKVLDNVPHSHHGETVLCEAINVVGCTGQVRLLTKDVQPAVMKRTIDYIIDTNEKAKASIRAEIDQLRTKRMSLADKYKPLGRTMKANQALIDDANERLKSIQATAYLPKIKKTVTVSQELLANKEELEMFLASEVSSFRSQRPKDIITKKNIFGVEVEKVNGVYAKPNLLGMALEKGLEKFIKDNKTPIRDDKNYLGIEIECLHLCDRSELERLFIRERLHRHIQIVGDGSIVSDASGYKQSEIRLLAHEDELEDVLAKVGKVLGNRRVDAYANRSCGLHVHLDARNRSVEQMYENLFNIQTLLRNSQPTSRLVSTYCKENKEKTFKLCKRNDDDRYRVINTNAYEKQKSLEVRVHEGTVDTKEIGNWCKFLNAVVNKDLKIDSLITTVDQFKTTLPSISTDYIASRISKYGNDISVVNDLSVEEDD